MAHFPDGFGTWFHADGSVRFRASFLCGGMTHDAVVLSSAEGAAAMCAVCEDTAKGPCVYRCFDSETRLIYIGSAKALLKRQMTHQSQSPWWGEVTHVAAEYFPGIFEARVAERRAIEAESPLYNKQYNRGAA